MAMKLGKTTALLTFGSASLFTAFLLHFEVARMDSKPMMGSVIIQPPYKVTNKQMNAPSHPTLPSESAKRKPNGPPSTRRFPVRGTPEFTCQCSWTLPDNNLTSPECSILVRPDPLNTEGMSLWIDQVVAGYLLAKQARCKILLDYGGTVDIQQVLIPFPNKVRKSRDNVNDWTVPSGFKCDKQQDSCYHYRHPGQIDTIGGNLEKHPFAPVPNYRFAYFPVEREKFKDLMKALPGFEVETGMACSLGNLFHLAPVATQFVPQLFSKILPTLRDENNLVMGLYVRTGETDDAVGNRTISVNKSINRASSFFTRCAVPLEEKYVLDSLKLNRTISRVIWMLVTDSPTVKNWTVEKYTTDDAKIQMSSLVIPREVVTTGSRGAHTKPSLGPSTVDFAEAFIDWYLLGETDLVVGGMSYTFGSTAAMRTARPYYRRFGGNMCYPLHF